MIKKILFPIIAVIIFIAAVGIFLQKASMIPSFQTPQPSSRVRAMVNISGKDIFVEVAKSESEREKGLSERDSLGSDNGMLFIFNDKTNSPVFWMKNMLIPIDIIWIDGGKIIKIDKNVPVPDPNVPDYQIPTYSAGQPVDYVLEVNSGFCNSNSIKVGDSVTFSE